MATVAEDLTGTYLYCQGCGCVAHHKEHHLRDAAVKEHRRQAMQRAHRACVPSRRYALPPVPVVAAPNTFSQPSRADLEWAKLRPMMEAAGLTPQEAHFFAPFEHAMSEHMREEVRSQAA